MLQERLQNQGAGPFTRLLPLISAGQNQPAIVPAPPSAGIVQTQLHLPTIVTAPAVVGSMPNQQLQPTRDIENTPTAGSVQNQPIIVTAPPAVSSTQNQLHQPTLVTAPPTGASVQNQQHHPTIASAPAGMITSPAAATAHDPVGPPPPNGSSPDTILSFFRRKWDNNQI